MGANIVAGNDAPVRGVLEAYGMAAGAMINAESRHSLAVPSMTVVKDGKTTVVIGDVPDSVVAGALSSGILYGAYWNVLTEFGVSAMFNGAIGSPDAASAAVVEGFAGTVPIPTVVSNKNAAVAIRPDNFAPAIDTIVFVGSEAKLSAEEAKNK